jgi:hypothetical protein
MLSVSKSKNKIYFAEATLTPWLRARATPRLEAFRIILASATISRTTPLCAVRRAIVHDDLQRHLHLLHQERLERPPIYPEEFQVSRIADVRTPALCTRPPS